MKKQIFVGFMVLAAVITGTAQLVFEKPAPKAEHNQAEWNELNAKVERLERTTAALQKELAELQKPVPILMPAQTGSIVVPMASSGAIPNNQLPAGSRPFVFNGITYYDIPLAQAR
jgi:outer membrane murein-binding lipoprotein Lpp